MCLFQGDLLELGFSYPLLYQDDIVDCITVTVSVTVELVVVVVDVVVNASVLTLTVQQCSVAAVIVGTTPVRLGLAHLTY